MPESIIIHDLHFKHFSFFIYARFSPTVNPFTEIIGQIHCSFCDALDGSA